MHHLFLRMGICSGFAMLAACSLRAQDHITPFSTSAVGASASITNWGVNMLSTTDIQRDLLFMGSNTVKFVMIGFQANSPTTNNTLTASQISDVNYNIGAAGMVPGASWVMSYDSGAGVDPYYQSGAGTVYADRWATNMEVWQRYYNHPMAWTMPFNEPDYGWGEGSQQNLYDIMGYLLATTNYASSAMAGGTTLNDDVALSWFNAISPRATIGTTHCLAGSVAGYVNFIQSVTASGGVAINPEAHNVMEAIMGANYGLKGASWWGPAARARGSFAIFCQGKQLGYADDWGKWTAAAVYRATNGSVAAFLGGSERMATTTSYQFFSKDRDVFYDGYGPQRAFTVTVLGGTGYGANQPNREKVVNIAWGPDVQPAIGGRYIIVNRNSGKVLEVPGGSTGNGTQLDQNSYNGALYQQWDVNPVPESFGGDVSYFTITAAHDGITMDLNGYSFANGDQVQQWNGGTNELEQWYFQYTTNGYFKIRSRWSNKVVGVSGASTSSGAPILQWDDNGTPDHEWRLIPAPISSYDFVAPAPPSQVDAIANARSVQLNWKSNSEADFSNYTVLRGTNSGGPYEIIARGLTTNSFTDKFANQAKNYYYVLRAVDRSLNTSGNSAEVLASPSGASTLVARYSLNGNLADSSGNANNPIVTNGTPAYVAGRFGSAISFDGSSQSVLLPANMLAGVTNFTFAAWVYWAGGGSWQRIFDFGNDIAQYMFLTPSSGSGTLRFAITTNSSGGEQIVETSPLSTGVWQHVAVTRNGNTVKLYKNGLPVAVNSAVTISPANFNPAVNYLGKSQWADPLFSGRLDEVYIYNYALSDTEVARLSNNLPPPPVAPTSLSTTLTGNAIAVSWPSNYLGCRLESNSVGLTASDSWFTVAGSDSTNQLFVPIDGTQTNVFFRLVYP